MESFGGSLSRRNSYYGKVLGVAVAELAEEKEIW